MSYHKVVWAGEGHGEEEPRKGQGEGRPHPPGQVNQNVAQAAGADPSDATPPMVQIHPFNKIYIPFEPTM